MSSGQVAAGRGWGGGDGGVGTGVELVPPPLLLIGAGSGSAAEEIRDIGIRAGRREGGFRVEYGLE